MNKTLMEASRRITANLPKDLLDAALKTTKAGVTETLIKGLCLVKRQRAYEKGMLLKGKLKLHINLDQARERTRR